MKKPIANTKSRKELLKLLQDQKSGFYKFVRKNNALKTLGRDYIEGDVEKLYAFFISKKDPQWGSRMKRSKGGGSRDRREKYQL